MGSVEAREGEFWREPNRSNYLWRREVFSKHYGLNKYLKAWTDRKQRDSGYFHANQELIELDKKLWIKGVGSVSISDDGIVYLADRRAHSFEKFIRRALRFSDIYTVAKAVEDRCEFLDMEFPVGKKKAKTEAELLQKYLAAMARLSCPKWWRRTIRKKVIRHGESILRGEGFVREGKSPYLSNWAFRRWEGAQRRNAALMQHLNAVNELGEAVKLADCAKASVSNPEIRVAELIVRSKGFEAIADGKEWAGLFLTLTCPSRFHPQKAKGGKNPKYDGSTPLDAMNHLNKMWQLTRSKWARNGIRCFGFRVCEPHHDGTPHFHMAIFLKPELISLAKKIFRDYALLVDGDEEGASEYRCKVVDIDKAKGGMTGYLMKYITKNITGEGIDLDYEGNVGGGEGAQRVRAWASVWGIRQFQQIGTTPVTVWRELRKRKYFEDYEGATDEVREIKVAAESQNWGRFCELMGGPLCKRDELKMRPMYLESVEVVTRYGDDLKRVVGLYFNRVTDVVRSHFLATREHVWRICERVFDGVGAQPPPLDLCQ